MAAMSREVVLACAASGAILYADERAERLLGAKPGGSLFDLIPEGNEAKLQSLLTAARARSVDGWEVAVSINGQARVMTFSASPEEGLIVLVGSLVPDDYARALTQLGDAMGELATLHRELIARNRELQRLKGDLTDTERGIAVLHREVDEKTESLYEALSRRSRVIADLSHELKTPVNAILGLSNLLLHGDDGDLSPEHRTQVGFIQRGAEALSTLISDLLDISKADAGKLTLRITRFSVKDIFSALRGMLRPLLPPSGAVTLDFEEEGELPRLETDEGKVSQILRNLITNAIKFTEHGEVRVSASMTVYGAISLRVRDTGVGISAEDRRKLFLEFSQIENPLQRRANGTGLGLAISKRLATLLAGDILVESEPGRGSTFTLVVPAAHPDAVEMRLLEQRTRSLSPGRFPVLVVEDDRATLLIYERYLTKSGYQIVPARSIDDAREKLTWLKPLAIVLDVMLEGSGSWTFLAELKRSQATKDIPVIVATVLNAEQRARALGADEFARKPVEERWLTAALAAFARRGPVKKVLVVSGDDVTRYMLRKFVEGTPYAVLDTGDPVEAQRLARTEQPQVIFFDLGMPPAKGLAALSDLRIDPRTKDVPVVAIRSGDLSEGDRAALAGAGVEVTDKAELSRSEALRQIREAVERSVSSERAGRSSQPPSDAKGP